MQPDPSSTEQNLNKADEEFLTHQSRFSELTPFKILNITCLPLSIYQIATGLCYSSTYPSLLNISLASSGFLSLILTLFGLKWLRSTLKEGEKEIAPFSKKRESFSTVAFLVSTILKLTASPLILINLSLQKNQMRDYLTASNETQFGTSQAMTVFFILTEVLLFFYTIFSLAVTLKFAKRPRKIHSNFIYLANVALLGASLALVFNANRIYNTDNYPRLESLFPAWNLKSILLFGSLTAGLSLPVWLINYRKWRIGFFSLAAILGGLGLLLLLFNGFAYSHANRIYNEYSNTENLKDLKGRMSYVSEQELINYGCPAKYLPQDNCDNRLLVNAWENNKQSGQEYCLNINCAGVLGQLYSERYLQLANWGLIASITSILIAGSLLYSSIYRQAFSHERRSRKNLTWLGLLFTVGLACVLTYGFSPVRNIQEYDLKNEFSTSQDSIPALKAWDYVNYDNSEEGNYLDLRIPTPNIQAPNITIGDVENAAHSAFDGLKKYIENVDKSIEENKAANEENLPPEDKQMRDVTLGDIGDLARTAAGDLVAPIWSSGSDQETYLNLEK